MISKNDCMTILVKLEDEGIDVNKYVKQLLISKEVPFEVLKFIASNQGLEAVNFYEMLRKNHNKNKSPLYTNILRGQESVKEALITLSSLLTQVSLYGSKLESPDLFYKEIRAKEISATLNKYFTENNADMVFKLLNLIKTDLLVLEYINGKRELSGE